MGRVVSRQACSACQERGADRAGNNLHIYDDGRGFCHACGYVEKNAEHSDKEQKQYTRGSSVSSTDVSSVETISSVRALPERGIGKEIAERYGVRSSVDETTGKNAVHFYPYYRRGKLVAYKQRRLPKQFSWIGDTKDGKGLFGQQLYENLDRGKKFLVVSEGEVDCLSIAEILHRSGKDYAVVSLQDGAEASGTVKTTLKANAEFFSSFEKILLCFDNDAAGETYVQAVADWLCTMTSVAIMSLKDTEYKDVNEILMAQDYEAFWEAWKSCKVYQPESIVQVCNVDFEDVAQQVDAGYPFSWECMNRVYKGLRKGELTVACGGSGLGKTSVVREMIDGIVRSNPKVIVGVMSLEDSLAKAIRSYCALRLAVPLGRLTTNPDCVDKEEYRKVFDSFAKSGQYVFFDSSKFLDLDKLLNKVEYFARSAGCDYLIIDNLTLIAARSKETDERRAIDNVMASLAALVASTGMGIVLVNHLTRQKGVSPNNGDMVEIQHLRGSGAIEAFSDNIIAVERNQQSDNEADKNTVLLRALKNRAFGATGMIGKLQYIPETGRLVELQSDF